MSARRTYARTSTSREPRSIASFEPHGGVRKFLTQARIERRHAELYRADPRRHTVGDIAGSWGFFGASSFSRSFKAQFGMPPSAVLGAGSRQHVRASPEGLSWPVGQPFNDYVRCYREATGSGYDPGDGSR
jgi:AraC-like DNA-binding protein